MSTEQLPFKYIYHSHTTRCGHSFGTDEEKVLAAIDAGVKVYWFTDHCPIPGLSQRHVRMDLEQLDEYVKSVNYLKEKYKDKIEIHCGLEAEYSIENHDFLIDYVKNRGIEFLIFGEHGYLINNEWIWANQTKSLSKEELMKIYVNQVIDGMNKGIIKYLAHPDLYFGAHETFTPDLEESARKIIECAIKNNVILEYNIHGIANGRASEMDYPSIHFWNLVKTQYPEAIITIGMDAHFMDEFGGNPYLKIGLKEIEKLGLKITEEIPVPKLDI